jgi:chromosome segregation ATPase
VTAKEQCKRYSVLADQISLRSQQEGLRRELRERCEREIGEMRGVREEQEKELGGIRRELEEGKGAKAALEGWMEALEYDIKGLFKDLARSIDQETRLREEITALEEELVRAEASLQGETRSYEENQAKKSELLQKIQQKEETYRLIQAENEEKHRLSSQEEEKIRQKTLLLKSKNNEIAANLASQQLLIDTYEREIDENMHEITHLCNQLDHSTKELAALSSQTSDITLKSEADKAEIEVLRREEEGIRTEYEVCDKEIRELEGLIARYAQELQIQQAAGSSKEQQLLAAEERVQTYEQQIHTRAQILDSTHLQLEQERRQLAVASEGLDSTLQALRNEEFQLKSDLEDRDLMGTSKLLYDSERVLRSEVVEIAEKTMERKHSEQVRMLEEERRRLEFKAEQIERLMTPRSDFGD